MIFTCVFRLIKYILALAILVSTILSPVAFANMKCADFFNGKIRHIKRQIVPPIQEISNSEFTNIKEFKYADFGIYKTAFYNGKKVFLKSKSNHDREVMWLSVLNSYGLGVKLVGVTKIDNADYVVTEFIEGTNSKFAYSAVDVVLTAAMVAEVKRQTRFIVDMGASPVDVQFMFTRDGKVILLDTEYIIEPEGYLRIDNAAIENWLNTVVGFIVEPWKKAGRYQE